MSATNRACTCSQCPDPIPELDYLFPGDDPTDVQVEDMVRCGYGSYVCQGEVVDTHQDHLESGTEIAEITIDTIDRGEVTLRFAQSFAGHTRISAV